MNRNTEGSVGEHLGIGRAALAAVVTLAIMYVVPFPIYGACEALGWVELPQGGSPAQFLLSVLVVKIGVSVAFVLLFSLARSTLAGRRSRT